MTKTAIAALLKQEREKVQTPAEGCQSANKCLPLAAAMIVDSAVTRHQGDADRLVAAAIVQLTLYLEAD